jgi:serine/threonine protein kinase
MKIHRDIKPANVLLGTPDTWESAAHIKDPTLTLDDAKVHLVDFGLSALHNPPVLFYFLRNLFEFLYFLTSSCYHHEIERSKNSSEGSFFCRELDVCFHTSLEGL